MNNLTTTSNLGNNLNQSIQPQTSMDPKYLRSPVFKQVICDLLGYIGTEHANLKLWWTLCLTNHSLCKQLIPMSPLWQLAQKTAEALNSRFSYVQVSTDFLDFDRITTGIKLHAQVKPATDKVDLPSSDEVLNNPNLFSRLRLEAGPIESNPIGEISLDQVDLEWMKAAEITCIWKEILTFLDSYEQSVHIDLNDLNYLVDGSLTGRIAQGFRNMEGDLNKVTASNLLNYPLNQILFNENENSGHFPKHLHMLRIKRRLDFRAFWCAVGSQPGENVPPATILLTDEDFRQFLSLIGPRLSEMQSLSLANNPICFLPNLERLTSLRELDLRNTPIFELSIANLLSIPSLEIFHPSDALLREIPESLAHLIPVGEEVNVGPVHQENGCYFPLIGIRHHQTHPSITEIMDEESSIEIEEIIDSVEEGPREVKRARSSDESSVEEPPHKKRKLDLQEASTD